MLNELILVRLFRKLESQVIKKRAQPKPNLTFTFEIEFSPIDSLIERSIRGKYNKNFKLETQFSTEL